MGRSEQPRQFSAGGSSSRPCPPVKCPCRGPTLPGDEEDNEDVRQSMNTGNSVRHQLKIMLLGPVAVDVGDVPIRLAGPRQVRLVAALATQYGRVVSLDRLVDAVWRDDRPPASARRQIQDLVSRLRRTLVRAGCGQDTITSHSVGYSLNLADGALDADLFR